MGGASVKAVACRRAAEPQQGAPYVRLPGWTWAAAAVYHGSKCISSSLCLLHAGLRLVLGVGGMLGRVPLAPATVPSLSPPLALGLTLCWLSLHLSPLVGTKPSVRQARLKTPLTANGITLSRKPARRIQIFEKLELIPTNRGFGSGWAGQWEAEPEEALVVVSISQERKPAPEFLQHQG